MEFFFPIFLMSRQDRINVIMILFYMRRTELIQVYILQSLFARLLLRKHIVRNKVQSKVPYYIVPYTILLLQMLTRE